MLAVPDQGARLLALAPARGADGNPRAPPTLFGGHADGLGFERQTLAYQIDVSPEVIELI
jgi:hypothetical protein